MKLLKEKTMIVLRVNNYHDFHFIEEHQKIIKEYGAVWMLKVGRMLASKSIKTIKDDGNYLILKEPKVDGGKYYFCHILEVYEGSAKKGIIYPEYYRQLDNDNIPLRGTWLKVEGILPIQENALDNFELVKSGKLMTAVVNSTRSPILFVRSKKDMIELEGVMCEEDI